MKELGLNQAELGAAIGQDKSAVTRSFQGGRMLSARDVTQAAAALKVSVEEVLRRIGLPVAISGVPIVGKLLGDSRVSTVSARKGNTVEVSSPPAGAQALIADTKGSPLDAFDGAVFVYAPIEGNGPVSPLVLGRICVLEIEGLLMPVIGVPGRGTERSKMSVTVFVTGERLAAEHLLSASPVHAILFPA